MLARDNALLGADRKRRREGKDDGRDSAGKWSDKFLTVA
jgi:hypothetical protein